MRIKITTLFLLIALIAFTGLAQVTHSVTIGWTASTTPGVTYNVYHASVSGGPYTKVTVSPVNALQFTDTQNFSGFWVVTSVDSNGDESIKSTEATVPNVPTGVKAVAN
jgi:hypothetical protein